MAKVKVEHGVLVGGRSKTDSGYEYLEFIHVPFAKPPVGDLRFKSPRPLEAWEGERDATTSDEKHLCPYFDLLYQNKFRGTEDCLYLNVYTPRLPTKESKPLPVILNIHGGGFVAGNGILKDEFGPDFLIEKDVVIVSTNYRTGIYGFLSLGIEEAAGNMGLKDQVMALKWIQRNIEQFGGNKDNVTIFGTSAGGASVEFLVVSPLASGLFHKAIAQAGSPLNPWAINDDVIETSIKLAQELGCQSTNIKEIHNFLLKQSFEDLGKAAFKYTNLLKLDTLGLDSIGFGPCVEKDFGNNDAFITEHPYIILKEGKFKKVPIITGFCEFEGLSFVGLTGDLAKDFEEKKPFARHIRLPLKHDIKMEYENKLDKLYSNDKNEKNVRDRIAVQYFGDMDFASGIVIHSKIMASFGVPVYFYVFEFSNDFAGNLFNYKNNGAAHGADVLYIFSSKVIPIKFSETEILLRERLTTLLTDFAKFGNPTPTTTSTVPVSWPTFDNDKQQYLSIDKDLVVKAKFYADRMALFEELYEKCRDIWSNKYN